MYIWIPVINPLFCSLYHQGILSILPVEPGEYSPPKPILSAVGVEHFWADKTNVADCGLTWQPHTKWTHLA